MDTNLDTNMGTIPNTVRVKLIKRDGTGLGFLVKERFEKPLLVISELVVGGVAEESGLVHTGDIILRVNDIDLTEMSYASSVELIKAIPVHSPAVLLLGAPEGHVTYLRTTFTSNGIPRTVRVTTPVNSHSLSDINTSICHQKTPSSPPKNTLAGPTEPNEAVKSNSNNTSLASVQKQKDYTKRDENTVLNAGTLDSPKIVLTCPPFRPRYLTYTENQNTSTERPLFGEREIRRGKGSIEIRQGTDEITVILKGDIQVERENDVIGRVNEVEKTDVNRKTECVYEGKDIVSHRKSRSMKRQPNKRLSSKSPDHTRQSNNKEQNGFSSRENSRSPTLSRRLSGRKGSNSAATSRRYQKLRFLLDDKTVFFDTLHTKAIESVPCHLNKCMGSILPSPARDTCRPIEELLLHANDFINQYYTSTRRYNTDAHKNRWAQVEDSIKEKGTYDLTTQELTFGAKTAWRNSSRCIGRIQWSKLQVFDARHITTARGMFEALCNHIKYATNKGNVRSAITIFPSKTDGQHDFRIWNAQLIRYAAYRQEDGSVMGDIANLEFTELCQKLGWKGKGGMFDVLPLLLSANGQDPEMFSIPPDLILEVEFSHPEFGCFAEMGLKWYALPVVSNMSLDCGGLVFTAAPFNGWYMSSEIGARDLCDPNRYNLMGEIGQKMGLDTRKLSNLWKDRVLVEVNRAVLYSFQQQNVTIIDHHAASESFIKHMENEHRLRGGCPADWVWIVPPISGSTCPVFHQEMINYILKPSYEYQEDAWKTHVWKKNSRVKEQKVRGPRQPRKFGFREIARAVKFSAKLMGKALARRIKCSILFATETGKSERYAKILGGIFNHAFDARIYAMNDYDIRDLEHEALVLIITSTFGNGDPPEMGEEFAKALHNLCFYGDVSGSDTKSFHRISNMAGARKDSVDDNAISNGRLDDTEPMGNVRYSVLGLGSRAYPNFCAFAKYLDTILGDLGAERIHDMVGADELCGQEQAFQTWACAVFKAACETFCVGDDVNMQEATGALSRTDHVWKQGKYRLTPVENDKELPVWEGLSKVHGRTILPCMIKDRKNLQAKESNRRTILVKLDTHGHSFELSNQPGDHVAIYPANQPETVDVILSRLQNAPLPDQLVKMEILEQANLPLGSKKEWVSDDRFPPFTLRTAIERYLDVTSPVTSMMLQHFASLATDPVDEKRLTYLAKDSHAYEDWKYHQNPNLAEVLEEFQSVRVPPSLLLSQLPLLQQRFYSISSAERAHPGEIHATVAVVRYKTQGGAGPEHHGVCSSWLDRIDLNEIVPCFVRTAPSFHMPEDNTVPIIMVGPGTGVAPFRSFWQHRKIDREMMPEPIGKNKTGWGDMALYFGCRQSNMDDIYRDEKLEARAEGTITELHTALSREPGLEKEYVQDILLRNSAQIYRNMMEENGHFYVCGDVSMASDVCNTLQKILRLHGDMTQEEAKNYVLHLRDEKRFHEDIFGVTLRTSEVQDRMRDKSKRAWKTITGLGPGTPDKPSTPDIIQRVSR